MEAARIGYSAPGPADHQGRPRLATGLERVTAASLSATLADDLPWSSQTLCVHSVHQQACNILSDQGKMYALVQPRIGNGPFTIVLERPVSFAGIEVEAPVTWQESSLQCGHLAVDLSQAMQWDPVLHPAVEPIATTSWNNLRQSAAATFGLPDLGTLTTAMADQARQAANQLRSGLQRSSIHDIQQGTTLLAGLGVGLTPAGDDFLLGFMARIWFDPTLLPPRWTAPGLCKYIAQIAGPRTTCLSRAWLDHAACGHFAEPWHDLANALKQDVPVDIYRAADRILKTGATSGRDALAGFLFNLA